MIRRSVLCALLPLLFAAAAQSQSVPPPKVIRVIGTIEADQVIEVYFEHLAEWVSPANDPSKLIPYIGGLGLRGNYPVEVHASDNHLHFHLRITPQTRDTWINVMGAPTGLKKLVTFRVGPETGSPFDTVFDDRNPLPLVVVDKFHGVVALLVVLGMLAVFLRLARNTNLIREPLGEADDGSLRAYSLGRTQMAFWFLLVCMSYIAIWLITGALDTITASLLGLMGISAGTALGEAMIDADRIQSKANDVVAVTAQKQAVDQSVAEMQTQPAPADAARLEDTRTRQYRLAQQLDRLTPAGQSTGSRGFVRDLLAGAGDYSLHRFQICVWTIVLGIMFLSSVYNELSMPEFSATLLGLMGISSGTYIGFKFPESG